ncbi:MAG: hypothetical protein RBT59_07385 [Arcobacteraceae bacterium]|jgi:hypothetical protein|nr:hypothetical protein [Arcobacteraceae bacterium]
MNAISKYSPEMKSIFQQFDIDKSTEDYAFKVYEKLLFAKKSHEVLFLVIGKLLKTIRDEKLYKKLDYETFEQFLGSEEISFSRESAFLYIRVYTYYVEYLELSEKKIREINVSRLSLMIPVLKKIKNKEEIIDKIDELNSLRHGDFVVRVKQNSNKDKPSVYFSEAINKWVVTFYEDKTELHNMGTFQEFLDK